MTAPVRKTTGPDVDALFGYFLTPLMVPAQVVTKLADADDIDVNGAVRVEGSIPTPSLENRLAAWDCDCLIHTYSPDEIEAVQLGIKCVNECAVVRGQTIMGWYIVDVLGVIGGQKLPEPGVEGLVRYRSAVTWRVAAHPTE